MTILSGENIICFAHEPWHGPWKTYQQVMSLFAETNRVLYVGPPHPLREGLTALLRGSNRRPILETVTPTLHVYHGPHLLGKANQGRSLSRPFNWTTGRLRLAQVKRLARGLGMTSPILWVFDPMMVHVIGAFGEKLVVAYVLDNYVEFFAPEDTFLRAMMAINQEKLLRAAHIVFAVSDSLRARCIKDNPNAFLIPNGVNYELFEAAVAKGDVPPDVRGIARPIIGFVGAIQPIVDFSLLDYLSREHPEWSLALVGPDESGRDRPRLQALLQRPNVHYLGCKAVREVPSYMHACDVCLIPYHVDKGTVPDSDKIKLYEYLACGRPIVSTDIPSSRKFRPLVEIARDPSDFGRCVEKSLREEPHWSHRRRAVAREHSWRKRVEALSEAIGQRLDGSGLMPRSSASPTQIRGTG